MCLRCGKEENSYCEDCMQEIIAENLKLQLEINELKKFYKRDRKRPNNTIKMTKKFITNKTGYTGVCIDSRAFKRTGKEKYRAYITFQNKQINLGTYNTLEQAIEARKNGEKFVHEILEKLNANIN